MNSNQRTLTITAVVVLVLAGAALYWTSRPAPAPSPAEANSAPELLLGAILPLTGPSAFLGEREQMGIELAVETLKAGNGPPIDVLFGDSQNQAAESIAEYRRLWQVRQAPVLITAHSTVAGTISELMKGQPASDLPVMLSIMANATYITGNSEMIFRCYPTGRQEAVPMARFAYQELGLRRIALYVQNDDYGLDARQAFTAELEALGGTVVAAETFEKTTRGHRSALLKVAQAKPDGVYVIGNTPAYGNAFRQIREQGIDAALLTGSAFGVGQFRDLAGPAADGVYATTTLFDSQLRYEHPVAQAFIERFRERYGEEPSFLAAFGYSAVQIVAQAAAAAGSTDPQAIQQQLADPEAVYELPIGTIRFNSNRDAELPLQLEVFREGRFLPAVPAAVREAA